MAGALSGIGSTSLSSARFASLGAIKRLSRSSVDASLKLTTQERIVTPGDDALSFSTSRKVRNSISALKVVSESSQLQATILSTALNGLSTISNQLETLKARVVEAQVAEESERISIQADIDQMIDSIDATARSTRLGKKALFDGSNTINAFASIAANGAITDFSLNKGQSIAQTRGIQRVQVNRLGDAAPVRVLDDGSEVISLNVSINNNNKATRAFMSLVPGTAGSFAEFRITGRFGSTTLRLVSTQASAADVILQNFIPTQFNSQALETGVALTADGVAPNPLGLTTVGFGDGEFIKVELIDFDNAGGTAAQLGQVGTGGHVVGATATSFGRAAIATINGRAVKLEGEYGTTAHYVENGFDIEVDFSTFNLDRSVGTFVSQSLNIRSDQGNSGTTSVRETRSSTLRFGYKNLTTTELGKGAQLHSATIWRNGLPLHPFIAGTSDDFAGNQKIGIYSIADLSSGGKIDLQSGEFAKSIRTLDRALDQVLDEKVRLGSYQNNFNVATNRAQNNIGNLVAADADIVGVDAATEITNLVQSQLGISTATTLLSQTDIIQASIFSLLQQG